MTRPTSAAWSLRASVDAGRSARTSRVAIAWVIAAAIAVPELAAAAAPSKHMRATRIAVAPTIDGKLDEPAWREARFVGDFLQEEPVYRGAPSRRTEVGIVYDHEALYIGARMYANGPADIQAIMTRRDETGPAERIIVSLDPFRNRRTAYSFAVTAAGVRADWFHPDDSTFARDHSFNPVWSARVTTTGQGWFAEMRIPFTQLRFLSGSTQVWGININRYLPQRNEDIFWIPVPKNETGWSSYFGELRGLTGVRQPLRIEFLPYALGDATLTSSALIDPDDPFAETFGLGGQVGVDAKLGLGPGLTLDAAIFPDFAQVEADPAQVNLSAFELFFDERRPFFTEGSQLLEGQGLDLYYSRRIGGAPRSLADDVADYSDSPRTIPIAAAAKLTGRVRSGTSVGVLAAVTPPITAQIAALDDPGEARELSIEPLTAYGVLRAQQEIGPDSSIVGASFTTVARALDPDTALGRLLPEQAHAGGLDWSVRFSRNTYELRGHVGFSHIRGTPEAIAEISQTAVHYFQRPDQAHVAVKQDRTSMTGLKSGFQIDKRKGEVRWNVQAGFESPEWDVNDLGRLQSADDLYVGGFIEYRNEQRTEVLDNWQVGLSGINEWNFGGERDPGLVGGFVGVTLENYWNGSLQANLITPGQSDFATRGGPLTGVGWGGELFGQMSSPRFGRNRVDASVYYANRQTGDTGVVATASVNVKPINRLTLSLAPSYRRMSNNRQYIDTYPGDNADTFGDRYVFGTIDYRELAMQVRMQIAFTPDLTLEAYAEPFAASGAYDQIGELPAPRSRDLAVYGDDLGTIERMGDGYAIAIGDESLSISPDFTALSFRSTAVLRWEFLPGSTAFLVWQQDRSDDPTRARGIGPGSWADAVTTAGRHTLALKIAYWWSVD